jgi:hypothetical protein
MLNDEIYKNFNKKKHKKWAKSIWVNPLSTILRLWGGGNPIKSKSNVEGHETEIVMTRLFRSQNRWVFFCKSLDSQCFLQYHSPIRSPLHDPHQTRELEEKTCSFNPPFQPMFKEGESSSLDRIYTDPNASPSSSSTSSIKNHFEMAIQKCWTLKELATPNLDNQPLCIHVNDVNFELKSSFIHLLPSFKYLAVTRI